MTPCLNRSVRTGLERLLIGRGRLNEVVNRMRPQTRESATQQLRHDIDPSLVDDHKSLTGNQLTLSIWSSIGALSINPTKPVSPAIPVIARRRLHGDYGNV